jgi:hypothetical protein
MPVLTGLLRYLRTFAATFGDVSAITVPGELLSLVGLNLGSSSRMNAAGVYIEPAMQMVSGWDKGGGVGSKQVMWSMPRALKVTTHGVPQRFLR